MVRARLELDTYLKFLARRSLEKSSKALNLRSFLKIDYLVDGYIVAFDSLSLLSIFIVDIIVVITSLKD